MGELHLPPAPPDPSALARQTTPTVSFANQPDANPTSEQRQQNQQHQQHQQLDIRDERLSIASADTPEVSTPKLETLPDEKKPTESLLDTPILTLVHPTAIKSASVPSSPTPTSLTIVPPPPLSHRKSAGRPSHKRRMSGGVGSGTASHFSKPIEMPMVGLRIEAAGAPPGNVAALERVQSGDMSKKVSLGKEDAPPSGFQSPRQAVKSSNALKKQITKVVPTISKIASGGHRKRVKDGEMVFKGHRNWEIVLSIQFGLRYTSELLEDANGVEPTDKDYKESLAFDFNPVDDQRSVFDVNRFAKWVHPAPFVYRLIREKFGLSEEEFLEATCAESRVRELPTPGKSGALFYITDDEKYFMKTIQQVEEKMLISMLPSYYQHICENPNTLLTKYMAHFSVQTRRDRHIRMVVMASIFNDQIFIDRKYDLKGSTYKRFASPEALKSQNVTLKDQDFDEPIYFRPEVLDRIMQQLGRDSAFLESHGVMDYSLLLGVSDMCLEEDASFKERYGGREEDAPYFVGYQHREGKKRGVRVSMGIIDFLQRFRLRKKVEYAGRVMQSCSTSSASVAPPHLYRERFMAFLNSKFLADPELDVSKLVLEAGEGEGEGEGEEEVVTGEVVHV